jgi:CRP/FNR family transcriptional regulator, cyclic AMP receptor protein
VTLDRHWLQMVAYREHNRTAGPCGRIKAHPSRPAMPSPAPAPSATRPGRPTWPPPTLTRVPLLRADPDLGRYLSPTRRAAVEPELWTVGVEIPAGPWRGASRLASDPAAIGAMVLDGLIARELRLADTTSADLFGPGDIIRPDSDGPSSLDPPVCWTVLQPLRAAALDARVTAICQRSPELMMAVLDRINAQSHRLALSQAISHLTGVDRRVEALLWHLADRWGKVTPDGVVVPVPLSHRLLGSLVGARRPTVSTALADLTRTHRVMSLPSGDWLLTGTPPSSGPSDAAFTAHRPARGQSGQSTRESSKPKSAAPSSRARISA